MDARSLFPRTNGRTPFLLLDGHGSRTELEFLQHANDPKHKWVACLGVPHGAAHWQVGDSSEQNGYFNMSFARAKSKMVSLKTSLCMDSKLQPADAMILINEAWSTSFANINANKRAICDRGWFPLNRILLHHPNIRTTMTDEEKKLEKKQLWFSECANDNISNNNVPSTNE